MILSRHYLKNNNMPPPPCYGSINTFDEVKSSGFINFLSRITGQSVHITAQKLIHNAVHIKGENVTLDVENIEYVELPAAYREFESFGFNMGASAGLDGTFNPSFGFRWCDGDTVISAYVDSALIEAAQKLKKWLDNPTFDFPTIQEKEPPKTNVEEDTSNEQENAESKKPNLETKKQTKDEHAEEKERIEAERYFEFAKDRYGKENFENASHKVQKAYRPTGVLRTKNHISALYE